MATIQEPVQNASVLCHEAKRWLLRFTRKLIRRRGGEKLRSVAAIHCAEKCRFVADLSRPHLKIAWGAAICFVASLPA